MRVVLALGGNALLQRGQPLDAAIQPHNIALAAQAIAAVAQTHAVIVTHGNGPQVGLLALQADACPGRCSPIRWTCWTPKAKA
jgi:carbamate kinase